jgi:hypothetical protein
MTMGVVVTVVVRSGDDKEEILYIFLVISPLMRDDSKSESVFEFEFEIFRSELHMPQYGT